MKHFVYWSTLAIFEIVVILSIIRRLPENKFVFLAVVGLLYFIHYGIYLFVTSYLQASKEHRFIESFAEVMLKYEATNDDDVFLKELLAIKDKPVLKELDEQYCFALANALFQNGRYGESLMYLLEINSEDEALQETVEEQIRIVESVVKEIENQESRHN